MVDGGYFNKIKRFCFEDVIFVMGLGVYFGIVCVELQVFLLIMNFSFVVMGVVGQLLLLENNFMNGNIMGLLFVVLQIIEVGLKGFVVFYYEKINSVLVVDQEF